MADPKNAQTKNTESVAEQEAPALPPELASRFVTEQTALTQEQTAVIRANTFAIAQAAEQLVTLPSSRERSLALTALEEAQMWANKAVFA